MNIEPLALHRIRGVDGDMRNASDRRPCDTRCRRLVHGWESLVAHEREMRRVAPADMEKLSRFPWKSTIGRIMPSADAHHLQSRIRDALIAVSRLAQKCDGLAIR